MRPKPSITRTVLLLAASVLALPTLAQNKPADTGKKLYCWDEGGKHTCSDTLPPEALNNAREEFNARSGLRSAEVQRALTAEERADDADHDVEEDALLGVGLHHDAGQPADDPAHDQPYDQTHVAPLSLMRRMRPGIQARRRPACRQLQCAHGCPPPRP